jgi:hypothetical protein
MAAGPFVIPLSFAKAKANGFIMTPDARIFTPGVKHRTNSASSKS